METCVRQAVTAPCLNALGRMIEMGQQVANGDDVLAMSHRQHFRKSGEPCVLLGLRGDPVTLF